MRKVIVTGGAGFIGTWLCQKLVDDGDYVVAIDRKMPEFGFAPAHEYHVFDLRNSVDFYDQFRFQDADEVYSLAAEMGGAQYVFTGENDAEIMHSSATINLHVLEACRRWGVKKVFFASSACVYPSLPTRLYADASRFYVAPNTACMESDAANPDSPYGLEKLFSERLYESFGRNHGIDCRIGRFHNVFGEYGTWRGGREKAPAAICRKVAEAEDGGTILIFGDGEQARSFLHASEAVEAVSRLMASDFKGPVNIGSSEMVTINQLVAVVSEIAGKKLTVEHVPGPIGVLGRNSHNGLIEEKLKWKPTASLRDGLAKTYPWVAEKVAAAQLTRSTLLNSV